MSPEGGRGDPPEADSLDALLETMTFPLTACDEAFARDIFARMLSMAFFKESDFPVPRDLVTTPRDQVQPTKEPAFFCGLDLEHEAHILHAAIRRTIHKIRRYLDKAFDRALANAYVPLRRGILDPLLRDPCGPQARAHRTRVGRPTPAPRVPTSPGHS